MMVSSHQRQEKSFKSTKRSIIFMISLRYIFFTSGFIRKVKIGFFFNQVNNYAHFLKNILILNQKVIFSTSAKIGLSCDIKSLFRKSVDKKLHIFNSISHPVLLHFFDFFYDDFIPLSNIFRSQKKLLNFLYY